MNFYQRMGILPLKKCVNRDKCSFTTKQLMFGVFAIDEILRNRWTLFVGSRTLCHPAIDPPAIRRRVEDQRDKGWWSEKTSAVLLEKYHFESQLIKWLYFCLFVLISYVSSLFKLGWDANPLFEIRSWQTFTKPPNHHWNKLKKHYSQYCQRHNGPKGWMLTKVIAWLSFNVKLSSTIFCCLCVFVSVKVRFHPTKSALFQYIQG